MITLGLFKSLLKNHVKGCLSPVLSRYAKAFKEMIHQGTELKKEGKSNPLPKHPKSKITNYHNVTRQNEWLRANVFDSVCIALLALYLVWEYPKTGSHTSEILSTTNAASNCSIH